MCFFLIMWKTQRAVESVSKMCVHFLYILKIKMYDLNFKWFLNQDHKKGLKNVHLDKASCISFCILGDFPSMYYKFYRRRHYFYYASIVIGILFLLTYRKSSSTLEKDARRSPSEKNLGLKARSRINIITYKEPEPCIGCPGENGMGVVVQVCKILLFLLWLTTRKCLKS